MFDGKALWKPHTARQTSAAKGLMGARPHMHMMVPD
jgi:hypothetical protein